MFGNGKKTIRRYHSSDPGSHLPGAGTIRYENNVSELLIRQVDVASVAPQTWSDCVEVLTAMFAPPNLLSNLCIEIATVRQGGTEHLVKSVDQCALRISSLFTLLLAESKRTAP